MSHMCLTQCVCELHFSCVHLFSNMLQARQAAASAAASVSKLQDALRVQALAAAAELAQAKELATRYAICVYCYTISIHNAVFA
jgi:hypothetical protein